MTSPQQPPEGSPPKFDPSASHQARPKLRPVRGFAAQATGPDGKSQPILGLADARQISEKVVFTMPGAQLILPLMDGNRDLDGIVTEVGRGLTREMVEQLVAQLDDAALLEGPTFNALQEKSHRDFDSMAVLPPASTAAFADSLVNNAHGGKTTEEQRTAEGPRRVREAFDQWIAKALEKVENPSLDTLPKAIMTPHVDYPRGWLNYASVYGRLRVCDPPDRVVILGTNHFGQSTGVCGCDKGFQTPLGQGDADTDLIAKLRSALGDKLFVNRFDHEHEHSIELQVMWIQHVFGSKDGGFPKVFGALVHDPSVNNGDSYDGNGVGLQPFVDALKQAIRDLPGRTLIVSSADLSHAGPGFGDQKPLAGESPEAVGARNKVLQHDQEMLQLVGANKPAELVASMAWQQNPTRWCSVGNIVATLLAAQPEKVELLNYMAAMDEQGMTLVSSASMLMT